MEIDSQLPIPEFGDGRNRGRGSAETRNMTDEDANRLRQIGAAALVLESAESGTVDSAQAVEVLENLDIAEADECVRFWERLLARPQFLEWCAEQKGFLSESLRHDALSVHSENKKLVLALMNAAETDDLLRRALSLRPSSETATLAAHRSRTEELRLEIAADYAEDPVAGYELLVEAETEELRTRIWAVNKSKRVACELARSTEKEAMRSAIMDEHIQDVDILSAVVRHTHSDELLLRVLRDGPHSVELALALAERLVELEAQKEIFNLYGDHHDVLIALARYVDDRQLRAEILDRLPELLENRIKKETKTVVVERKVFRDEDRTFSGQGENAEHRFDCSYA